MQLVDIVNIFIHSTVQAYFEELFFFQKRNCYNTQISKSYGTKFCQKIKQNHVQILYMVLFIVPNFISTVYLVKNYQRRKSLTPST